MEYLPGTIPGTGADDPETEAFLRDVGDLVRLVSAVCNRRETLVITAALTYVQACVWCDTFLSRAALEAQLENFRTSLLAAWDEEKGAKKH